MPQQPYPHDPILLDVCDRRQGDLLVKQRVEFLRLTHDDSQRGFPSARIDLKIWLYSPDGDGYGERLQYPLPDSYPDFLTADNDTLVDVSDPASPDFGRILAIRSPEFGADWEAEQAKFEHLPTMLQGNFFLLVRDTQQINLRALLLHHIQQADAMGRFA
ncbi:hypothetical protein [uncultured Hymenobacter sp.]|uniref:hypothetical protein n=1 Tax=uncultured Hymenobacter sp. TaxID=170016 RepID=UPI0035CBCB44